MKAGRRLRSWLLVTGGGLLALGAGCSTRTDQSVRLSPSARPFESDIPVPVGFWLVEPASEDASTGTRRLYLRHTYEGRDQKIAVRAFYREQMPLCRWVKVSDGNVKGEYTLRYEKGGESCTVQIRDSEGLSGGSRVQVIVSQEQRGAFPPKASNRP